MPGFPQVNSHPLTKYFKDSLRIFQASYQQYDHHLPRFFGVMIIPVLFLLILNYVLSYFHVTLVHFDRILYGHTIPLGDWIALIILVAVIIFAVALLHIAIYKMIQANEKEERLGVFAAYRQALPMCGAYLQVQLITIMKVILWSWVFLVPGFIFGIFYSIASIVFIVDGKRGIEALAESKRIIKSNWLAYLGNLSLLMAVVYLVFNIADVLLANTFGVNEVVGDFSLLAAIGEGLFYLCMIALSIFPPIFLYYLYKHMKKVSKVSS